MLFPENEFKRIVKLLMLEQPEPPGPLKDCTATVMLSETSRADNV